MGALSTVAAMAVAALLLPMEAASPQEWEDVSEYEASIVFHGEEFGLAADSRMTRKGRATLELGFWSGRGGDMSIFYLAMRKGRVMKERQLRIADDLVDMWSILGSQPSFGQEGKAVNVLGIVKYVHIRVDEKTCFGFVQLFGREPGDMRERYTKLLNGIYCKENAGPLSSGFIENMLKSIGIKGFKEP